MSKEKRDGILTRAADMFDMPPDALTGVSCVEITGERDVLIENHKGILEYGDDCIRVSTSGSNIRIEGDSLFVSAMNPREIRLGGKISRVVFE